MRRRTPIPADGNSYGQNNGTLNRGDITISPLSGLVAPSPSQNAILVEVDLVEVSPIAIDGSVVNVDGVACAGRLVLLTAQADPTENGIWRANSGAGWDPYNTAAHRDGLTVNILEGDVYQDSTWKLVTDNDIDRGTTALEFLQVPYLDHAKAVTSPAPGIINVPAAGTIPGTFTPIPNAVWATGANGFPDELPPIHFGPNPLGGVFSFDGFRFSGSYYIDVSVLCNHPATSAVLCVAVAKNGAYVQEVIRRVITTVDERHHGGVNVTVDAVAGDRVDVFLYDPVLLGYAVNVQEVYVDIIAGNRR